MAKKSKRPVANKDGPAAVIEFEHVDLELDSAGRLAELPGLLEAVAALLAAFAAVVGKSIDCAFRPHSSAGCYSFDLWADPPNRALELGDREETDPFHIEVNRLVKAWDKIKENSNSESPKPLRDIGVSKQEFRALKELSRFGALNVGPRLRTADGRKAELPVVDPELLGKVKASDPEDQKVDSLVTGIAYTVDGTVMLHLEFARWVRAPFVSLREVSAQLSDQARAVGTLKSVEGSYEFQGERLNDGQISYPLPLTPV